MSSIIRAEDEQSLESPFLILLLPEEVIFDIIARVPRCNYPTLSLVSKHFRSLVSSPELYARRSLLGFAEHCLYVLLYDYIDHHRWHILLQKPNGNRRLVPIPSFPGGSFVAAGSKIYVFGGISPKNIALGAFSIDCRSHTVQTLPSMPIPKFNSIAGVINGKIYVIGYCDYDIKKVMRMVVFNTETQLWEPEIIKTEISSKDIIEKGDLMKFSCVVMAEKIYMRKYDNTFVYDPKKSEWDTDEMLNSKMWRNACVVDDVLYDYDSDEKCLRTYDPKTRCWGVVSGLEDLLAKTSWWSETVSYGGKLALFSPRDGRTHEFWTIWCAEISLERRQEGEIWGEVEWCGQVMDPGQLFIAESLAVMV